MGNTFLFYDIILLTLHLLQNDTGAAVAVIVWTGAAVTVIVW